MSNNCDNSNKKKSFDLDYLIKPLFTKAKKIGFTECEIFATQSSYFEVHIYKGEIDQYKNSFSQGFSFRGMIDGKLGHSYSENMDKNEIDRIIDLVVENAKQNAEVIEEIPKTGLFKGSSVYPEYERKIPKAFSTDEKISLAKKMEEIALKEDKRVVAVDNCVVVNGESSVKLINDLGLNLSEENYFAAAYVCPRVVENEQTKVGFSLYKGIDFSDFNPEKTAKKAVHEAVESLGAKSVSAKKYDIILENKTATSMLSAFSSLFFAKGVQKGFSLLAGKLGEQIGSNILNIRDDGIYKDSIGNTSFDGEGVATKNKEVVTNGVLKTYLYNLETAAVDDVETTGNGSRGSFKSSVETCCHHFYIVPSSDNLEDRKCIDLCKNMKDGLLINDISGLHAGINHISGDFSLLAGGFLIENGEKVRPVEQITISGNVLELFNNICEIGSDLYFGMPSSGPIGSPSILIKDIDVSGNEEK